MSEVKLFNLVDDRVSLDPSSNVLTVIYFLSPECPLCINYTLSLRQLDEHFGNDSLEFYGIFSKEWYFPQEVDEFTRKYGLAFTMLFDSDKALAATLNATVTPEVFVLNSRSEIVYSGKIDNWVNDLGKKKLEVSDHYLENALNSYLQGKEIGPKHTEPIGCLIE